MDVCIVHGVFPGCWYIRCSFISADTTVECEHDSAFLQKCQMSGMVTCSRVGDASHHGGTEARRERICTGVGFSMDGVPTPSVRTGFCLSVGTCSAAGRHADAQKRVPTENPTRERTIHPGSLSHRWEEVRYRDYEQIWEGSLMWGIYSFCTHACHPA